MAISYNFKIETGLSPKQLLEIGARIHDAEIDEKEPISLRTTGLFAVTVETKNIDLGEYGKNKYIQGYGFLPNISITFEQYPYEGVEISEKNLAKSVTALFQETKGKAILLFDYDETVAQRLDGDLIEIQEGDSEQYPDSYDWIVEEFDKAGLKYVRKVLRSPLQE